MVRYAPGAPVGGDASKSAPHPVPPSGSGRKRLLPLLLLVLFAGPGPGWCQDPGPAGADTARAASPLPRRIVSLAPSLTEILFSIGAQGSVVAVTEECTHPPAARELPKVGGITGRTIQLERIVAFRPDLVLSIGSGQTPVVRRLNELGIPSRIIQAHTVEEVLTTVRELGELTGHTEGAREVVDQIRATVQEVTTALAGLSPQERPRVFYLVWNRPLMTVGTSFVGELIELAGGRSLFADLDQAYPQISPEAVIERDPEVILGPGYHGAPLSLEDLSKRGGWRETTAVRTRRVYRLDGDLMARPGPRLGEALLAIARVLHPQRFAVQEPSSP